MLLYLKKDSELVIATIDYQCLLTESIQDFITIFVNNVNSQILSILEASILDYAAVESPVKFEGIFDGLQRKGNFSKWSTSFSDVYSRSSNKQIPIPVRAASTGIQFNPQNLIDLFESTLSILEKSRLDQTLINQIFSRIFYFTGAELFNRVITNRKYCSRTRCVSIRMNISIIEEFQIEYLPNTNLHFKPIQQLTQFVQVISSVVDKNSFMETIAAFSDLTLFQMRMAMLNYRYEVGEKNIADSVFSYVENYVLQLKQDNEVNEKGFDNGNESMREMFDSKFMFDIKFPKNDWRDLSPVISQEILDLMDTMSPS